MEVDTRHPLKGDPLRTFLEITQMVLQTSPLAMTFCDECFKSISSFDRFKSLAIAKQHKFNEMLLNDCGDFTEIHNMKLSSDPLEAQKIKGEFYDDNSCIDDAEIGDYEMDPSPPTVSTRTQRETGKVQTKLQPSHNRKRDKKSNKMYTIRLGEFKCPRNLVERDFDANGVPIDGTYNPDFTEAIHQLTGRAVRTHYKHSGPRLCSIVLICSRSGCNKSYKMTGPTPLLRLRNQDVTFSVDTNDCDCRCFGNLISTSN
jgi:hypothetical protein